MHAAQILARLELGEDSQTQFKVDITSPQQLAEEMVAFSNGAGGLLLIGVADTGVVKGLSPSDVRRLNQMISNVASQQVAPPIAPISHCLLAAGKRILALEIAAGLGKPYRTIDGRYLTRVGADKRKTHLEELQFHLQEQQRVFAERVPVPESGLADVSEDAVRRFLRRKFSVRLHDMEAGMAARMGLLELLDILHLGPDLETLLSNLGAARNGVLTLAGLLAFGQHPQRFHPMFTVAAVSFYGDDLGGNSFRDKEGFEGNLHDLHEGAMRFLNRNLRKIQVEADFNSPAVPEISPLACTEALVNALVHRDYFLAAPIKLLLFDNRLEIVSPGALPGRLTVAEMRHGISQARNPVLHSLAQHILPYTGLGTGVARMLQGHPGTQFENDPAGQVFRVIFPRREAFAAAPALVRQMPMEQMAAEDSDLYRATRPAVRPVPSPAAERRLDHPRFSLLDRYMLRQMLENPRITAAALAVGSASGIATVRRHLKQLKQQGLIRRQGADKNGWWEVVDE